VHREVAGNAAVFADPGSACAMADAIERVWSDEELHDTLVSRGHQRIQLFSWDRSAEKALALYKRLAEPS